MDAPPDILSRVLDFVFENPFIIIVVVALLASSRRNRRNQRTTPTLPPAPNPSRAQSKQRAQTLFPTSMQGDVVTAPTSITTVTPPPVTNDRPDDLMKDLVKRV